MTVYRVQSNLDDYWFALRRTGTNERAIDDIEICFTADHADTHDDIVAHAKYAHHGQQLYTTGNVATGLYVTESVLKKFSQDSTATTWIQKVKVATTQPELKQREDNPINRSVRAIERITEFEDVPSLGDSLGRPATNSAGDYITGFSISMPVTSYKFGGNFASIPAWVNLNGAINRDQISIPLLHRSPSGTVTNSGTVVLPRGTVRLIVDPLTLEPIEESSQIFFPIRWRLVHRPIGHSIPIINQGFSELVYLKDNGNVATTAEIVAENYERVVKRICLDDEGEPIRERSFLDGFGRKLPVAVPSSVSAGTVNVIAHTFPPFTRLQSNTLTLTDDWVGRSIEIPIPGSEYRYSTTITAVSSGVADVSTPWPDAVTTGVDVFYSGISATWLNKYPIANFSTIPMPTS
ncbi:hypothetical protein [Fuerstiella marisgermanici]|uniref:Uncharacterized protein n=1 Tax=Fuerstiella marisgermanici TaxID=1891926 RepID=A0A1P8WDM0_9PLAN|nr:hypothetical protein [Fuerstiella marisgermanici]APZ92165.1 hypothetical protein Fuma_01773 [Fuerstiella marisgermanici]